MAADAGASGSSPLFRSLHLDHVELCVTDLESSSGELVGQYGFAVTADNEGEAGQTGARSRLLEQGRIRIVLTQGLAPEHRASAYVAQHGDGVGTLGLGVADAAAAFDEAVRRGASPRSEPERRDGFVTAAIGGFGDVQHVLLQRPDGAAATPLPGFRPVSRPAPADGPRLTSMDHFAVCLEAGTLDATCAYYAQVLDFSVIFEEDIEVGSQAMISKVVQSASGDITLTLIEPDTRRDPGQIDEFLKNHGSVGVQHIAFSTDDIVRSVGTMAAAGVGFLETPSAYYRLLEERSMPRRHSIPALRDLNILMDEDHDGQLFQIFTRSVHSRRTLFMEVIERFGARTFGSNNIRALYEAVQLGRDAEESRG
ncbi:MULTISPECIES: 4-hydroxyphenylpyruvate dioxygenase [unclassified Streptomyces]|uniref:4-hydroxyphenylpyruvate dioxygenase n=1 Tax=unclassified Streptomyces TaxID=2593676 RepID=UPI0036E326C9